MAHEKSITIRRNEKPGVRRVKGKPGWVVVDNSGKNKGAQLIKKVYATAAEADKAAKRRSQSYGKLMNNPLSKKGRAMKANSRKKRSK